MLNTSLVYINHVNTSDTENVNFNVQHMYFFLGWMSDYNTNPLPMHLQTFEYIYFFD